MGRHSLGSYSLVRKGIAFSAREAAQPLHDGLDLAFTALPAPASCSCLPCSYLPHICPLTKTVIYALPDFVSSHRWLVSY
jgi:hypothetical protein